MIAESPDLLVDTSAFVDKPMKIAIPRAKIPLANQVKALQNVSKPISEPEKPCPDKENSAENAAEKASFSSIQNSVPPLKGPSPGPSLSSNPNPGPSPGQWCFNQPPGHQWLIPVMTPSEGLVYKPYPGPGFAGPVPGPNPPFLTPAYGIPAQHPHPQYPLPPFAPSGPSGPGPHGYFPTYGVPMMNAAAVSNSSVEQMNPRPIPSQASAGEASVGVRQPNGPSKNQTILDGRSSLRMSRDADRVRASRESSPVERMEDSRGSNETERANVLPLFPTAPSSDGPELDRPSQVIKVVPHNARSATESAARIFQSIQEERKQYDFV